MINIIKIKHSIKQILIASLCAVSALTFGGDGNLRQPLLEAPGQYNMQDLITIKVLRLGGQEVTEFTCEPSITTAELYEKVLPLFSNYQDSSTSYGKAPCCCFNRSAIIDGEVYRISPWADIDSIQELQRIFHTRITEVPANALIKMLDHVHVEIPASNMPIRHALTISNIDDNSATVPVVACANATIEFANKSRKKDRQALEKLNEEATEECLQFLCFYLVAPCVLLAVLSIPC